VQRFARRTKPLASSPLTFASTSAACSIAVAEFRLKTQILVWFRFGRLSRVTFMRGVRAPAAGHSTLFNPQHWLLCHMGQWVCISLSSSLAPPTWSIGRISRPPTPTPGSFCTAQPLVVYLAAFCQEIYRPGGLDRCLSTVANREHVARGQDLFRKWVVELPRHHRHRRCAPRVPGACHGSTQPLPLHPRTARPRRVVAPLPLPIPAAALPTPGAPPSPRAPATVAADLQRRYYRPPPGPP
jgi:hypothetical protein